MINVLLDWVNAGAGNLKIYVSIRECNNFLDAFELCPKLRLQAKLRLQDLTLHGIHLLVSGRLTANKHYLTRSSQLGFLKDAVVRGAEGFSCGSTLPSPRLKRVFVDDELDVDDDYGNGVDHESGRAGRHGHHM